MNPNQLFSIFLLFVFFFCSPRTKLEDDVYNFGFILFESLVGPIASEKGKVFFLNEKVREKLLETSASYFLWMNKSNDIFTRNFFHTSDIREGNYMYEYH